MINKLAICTDNSGYSGALALGKSYLILEYDKDHGIVKVSCGNKGFLWFNINRFQISEDQTLPEPEIDTTQDWLSSKSNEIIKVVSNYFAERSGVKVTKPVMAVCIKPAFNLTLHKEYEIISENKKIQGVTVVDDKGKERPYYSHFFAIESKLKFVICIDDANTDNLTGGKEYRVNADQDFTGGSNDYFLIIDDRNIFSSYRKNRFKIKEEE